MGIKLSDMKNINLEENSKNEENSNVLNETYEELKNASTDELMKRLQSEVKKQKVDGTFDIENIKDNIDKIKGYLPQDTYQNMLNILDSLK
ncbi:MAG: hypothetical protein IJ008_02585 [Clostridia bacterium]|nr:hypothetical protein [Clostridia bacterium]